jgi:hypothetical protein
MPAGATGQFPCGLVSGAGSWSLTIRPHRIQRDHAEPDQVQHVVALQDGHSLGHASPHPSVGRGPVPLSTTWNASPSCSGLLFP